MNKTSDWHDTNLCRLSRKAMALSINLWYYWLGQVQKKVIQWNTTSWAQFITYLYVFRNFLKKLVADSRYKLHMKLE